MLTQAMYHARELAMTRMEEEADQLGADGIVGVRLDIGRYEWGAELAEFIAVGTAVKHRGGELHRAPNGRPFTSDLSGPGLLDAAARRLPAGRAGDGQLRLPRRPSGAAGSVEADRPQHGDADVHAGAVRGPRAGDGADAGRGRPRFRRAGSSAPDHRAQPRLGLARDRVLRDRHRRSSRSAPITRSSSRRWCCRSRLSARRERRAAEVSSRTRCPTSRSSRRSTRTRGRRSTSTRSTSACATTSPSRSTRSCASLTVLNALITFRARGYRTASTSPTVR